MMELNDLTQINRKNNFVSLGINTKYHEEKGNNNDNTQNIFDT